MTTRFNIKQNSTFGVKPLPTGFDNVSVPDNLTIPPVGIEDVDVSLFNLFNDEIPFSVRTEDGVKKVPIIFASGEKWAMLKKGRALRDKNGTLLLPLITIGRTSIQQGQQEDITGRGINQQTGELVIKRRLSSNDRNYQSLTNRLLIKNQDNLAVNPSSATLNQVSTNRTIGELSLEPEILDGGLMLDNKLNNTWEVIVIPTPQFFTATYEVTVWTSYTSHMNEILECLISSYLPQGNAWRLDTKKGYWFIATVDNNTFNSENNFDDMSDEERIIKYNFVIKVPGYILASQTPGAPLPVRRYISQPSINFTISDQSEEIGIDDPYLGSDDPTLPISINKSNRIDQRDTGKTLLYPNTEDSINDPALLSLNRGELPKKYRKIIGLDQNGKKNIKYIPIKNVNKFTGETVYSKTLDLNDLSIMISDD